MINQFSVIRKSASSKENLSCKQLAILLFVYVNKIQASVKEYANLLGISKPAITRALDRLEECNFIQRKNHTTDRRMILITPTDDGQSYFDWLTDNPNGQTMTESIQTRS